MEEKYRRTDKIYMVMNCDRKKLSHITRSLNLKFVTAYSYDYSRITMRINCIH